MIGAALRLVWPTDFLFRQDEAYHLAYALDLSQEGVWPAYAWRSSVGVPNGPGFLWFLLAVVQVTSDPRVANLFVTLANVAALAMSVPLARRLFSRAHESTAVVALLATSPVAIWYSRKLWDPCVLVLVTVPALWATMHTLQVPRSRWVAVVPPLLALGALTHQSALFFALAIGAVLAVNAKRLAWRPALLGVGVAVAIVTPYVMYLFDFLSARGLGDRATSRWPDIDVVTNLLLDASGHNILQAIGREAGRFLLWPVPPLGLVVQLAAIPFYVYLFAGWAAIWPRRAQTEPASTDSTPAAGSLPGGTRWVVLALTVGLPLLFLVLRVKGVPHYFLPGLPALFALIVIGARRVDPYTGRLRRWIPSLKALVAVNVASWLLFQSYVTTHDGSDSYGLPYATLLEGCRAVDAAAVERGWPRDRPLPLLIDVPRDRGPIPYQYRFILERRLDRPVSPAMVGQSPEVILRVRWPRSDDAPPWEVVGPGS